MNYRFSSSYLSDRFDTIIERRFHFVMLVQTILHLVFSMAFSQTMIRIGILDDSESFKGILPIHLPNLTFCGQKNFNLQLHWINRSNSSSQLFTQLESEENIKHFYLISTDRFSTKLIADFCQSNQIPFLNFNEENPRLCSLTTSFQRDYFLLPNLLQILINYFKFNQIRNAVYIYDNVQSTDRIYQLLGLINQDDYFHSFSLDIRIIDEENIYSLLYSIEWNSLEKNRLAKYVILDLNSVENYQRIFEKISHMGLTSNSYQYIILSTFDACLWMNNLSFTGRLIYFDDQQRNCTFDLPPIVPKVPSLSPTKTRTAFYRSSLSFRSHPYSISPLNVREFSLINPPTFVNTSNRTLNSCHAKMNNNEEYLSMSLFRRQLPSHFSRIYSHSLFKSVNFIIRILRSNLLSCKTYRLKSLKTNRNPCHFADINIYSKRGSSTRQYPQQIELIGRYSTMKNHYQSCSEDKSKDSIASPKTLSSKIYYITTLFDEPFVMLRKGTQLHAKYEHPQADLNELRGEILDFSQLEGFCVDLAEQICTILNITCRFRIVEDGNFGSKNSSTGIWNGMVGEVASGKADMAIGPLTISQERMEVVDFSKPFMILGISIVIRKPDKQKPGVFSFMNPVSMEIWLCLSLAYMAVSAVLFLTSRVVNSGWRRRVVRRPSYRSFSYPKSVDDRRKSEIHLLRFNRESSTSLQSADLTNSLRTSIRRRYQSRSRTDPMDSKSNKKKKEKHNAVHLFGISNAFFFSFASFMRQSINLVPKSLSGRVAATSWWYFSLIFVSSYTANLVAFLTVEQLVTPIESVEDLAKQHEIKYGLIRNGTTAGFFEKSNVTLFQNMWSVMQKSSADVLVATNDEGVAKVRNSKGKYAVFIESTKSEYVNERLPCDTMKVGSDLDSKGYGIATRLGSSLTEAINLIITNLRESGFVDKLKQRWWYDRSQCTSTSNDKSFSELSLSSVTGLFYIFVFGIIGSCIIGLTEFLINAKNESETLQINFREILRIKMIENMIGMTIHVQRQLESFPLDGEDNLQHQPDNDDENEIIKQYTEYQLHKPQTEV